MAMRRKVIEEGDVFFFYRARVGVDEVRTREDVQRLYMVLAARGRQKYRVFVVGRKRMPEIIPGEAHPEERNWALNVLTTSDVVELRRELGKAQYETKTRGTRELSAANPAGEGVYELTLLDDRSELAYVLELPAEPGEAQQVLGIKPEAVYIAAVKNPAVSTPGAPAAGEEPKYAPEVAAKFAERRWIEIDDSALLDAKGAQLLLIGARSSGVEEQIGVAVEKGGAADVLSRLKLRRTDEGMLPLFTGEFPASEEAASTEMPQHLPPEKAPGVRGGPSGGRAAAGRSGSAAAVAKILAGVKFPMKKDELLTYATRHKDALDDAEPVLEVLRELPRRKFKTMAEVEQALGEIR